MFVAGSATTGGVPSPIEIATAECVHVGDVSVTVNLTTSGAVPDVGMTESDALVVSLPVPAVAGSDTLT